MFNDADFNSLFFINGVSRSGNHAIINWIKSHFKNCFFINNVDIDKSDFNSIVPRRRLQYHNEQMESFRTTSGDKSLILSYENRRVLDWNKSSFNLNPHQTYRFIIIRDFYNLMASVCKSFDQRARFHGKKMKVRKRVLKHKQRWIDNVQYVLSNPKDHFIFYNKWVTSLEYRIQISHSFNKDNNDEEFYKVANYNGGSSFDGMKYKNHPEEMDVLNRYEAMSDHPLMVEICNDPLCRDLNHQLLEMFK